MSNKARTLFFVRKLRQQLRNSIDGRIRKRFVVCILGLVTLGTGSAIADIYLLATSSHSSTSPVFPARTAIQEALT